MCEFARTSLEKLHIEHKLFSNKNQKHIQQTQETQTHYFTMAFNDNNNNFNAMANESARTKFEKLVENEKLYDALLNNRSKAYARCTTAFASPSLTGARSRKRKERLQREH